MPSPRLRLACLLFACASCGGGAVEDPEPYEDLANPVDPTGAPIEKQPIDPATVGSIQGLCLFEGAPPVMRELILATECPHHDQPPRQDMILVTEGRLANVMVSVRKGLAGFQIPPAPTVEFVLDQRGCLYTPHVSAMRVGQTLRVRNSDPLTHNVNISAKRNSLSRNVSQGAGADDHVMNFTRRERVSMRCDLHPWMGALVHVVDHPFYCLTGSDGAFEIAGLPPGEYQLEATHERLGSHKATVTVAPGEASEASFSWSN